MGPASGPVLVGYGYQIAGNSLRRYFGERDNKDGNDTETPIVVYLRFLDVKFRP
jgi:hypothetical protein